MSVFFKEAELKNLPLRDPVFSGFYWHLLGRAAERSASPGLAATNPETWWHEVFENVTTVAVAVRLKNDATQREWVRSAALTLAGLPTDEWIGPWFRDHATTPPTGHLETAHVSMALALALDLGGGAFTAGERTTVETAMREKGIALCRAWLDANRHLANWRCILLAGVAVPAAVLGDRALLEECLADYRFCCQAFQADGSYGESLQYAGYAAWALMMTHEALLRSNSHFGIGPGGTGPSQAQERRTSQGGTGATPSGGTWESQNGSCGYPRELPMPYVGIARWAEYSRVSCRAVAGWGDLPRPVSVNFNDSGALAGTPPDLLLHIAARAKDRDPAGAALARHVFDTVYADVPNQGPFHRSSFGFLNRYGFLTLALFPQAAEAKSPASLGLVPTARFESGPAVARSGWTAGGAVMAVSGVPEPLGCTGHLHADLNSVILAYGGEVFLADAGHSCYRNVLHEFETSTKAHNTCTFVGPAGEVQQRICGPRRFTDERVLDPPVVRPGRHLLSARLDDVSVFVNDAAAAYGAPVTEFTRFCILAGEHVVFLLDRVATSAPVRAKWNWLLNNRDGLLEAKVFPDRRVFRRGRSGMKMFFAAAAPLSLDRKNGYIHDVYDPLPGQPGEGKNGTGLYLNVLERSPVVGRRTVLHAFAMDSYGASAGWHFKQPREGTFALEGPGGACRWELTVGDDRSLVLAETLEGRRYSVVSDSQGNWSLRA